MCLYFAADNDSSVYPKLMSLQPYGPHCPVKKIDCKNHVNRNYRKNMREISVKTGYPIQLRHKLAERYIKIVHSVWAASKYWKANTGEQCSTVQLVSLQLAFGYPCY